jgi:hypothetical protein
MDTFLGRISIHIDFKKTDDGAVYVHETAVAAYASQTSTLTEVDERALGLSDTRILRSSFGAVQDKGQRRRRYKVELHTLYDMSDLDK